MPITKAFFNRQKPVPYGSIRKKIRSGDILLCSGRGVFSKMIQKATDSMWSHVAFIIRLDAIDRIMVLESVESVGVRTVPLSHYVSNYKGRGKGYPGKLLVARHDDFPPPKSAGPLNKMSKFAVDLFGYPYDKDEIIKIAGRIIFGFKRRLKRDKEYICSEYAWECYKSVGITIPHDKRGFVAPEDFARDEKVNFIARVKVK